METLLIPQDELNTSETTPFNQDDLIDPHGDHAQESPTGPASAISAKPVSESGDANEPVEVDGATGTLGEGFSEESVDDPSAQGEEENHELRAASEASEETTEGQGTRSANADETPEGSADGKPEVDLLEEEVIKPAKQSVVEKFKAEIERIRTAVQSHVGSLTLDDSQQAEVERQIERFRSAKTIVTGGSAKKPNTKVLTEELRALLLPAVEIVVPLGVHLGKADKQRIVEAGRILDPIHKAISDGKLGIWRGFCELCGVSHTQMYKYINLFRSFGESLTEFHEFTLTELEQFKSLKKKAAQHVRNNLDALRSVRGDLEAVKKIAGKTPTTRKPPKKPWVKPIQYEGCIIRVNTKTGRIEGEHFFGKFDDLEKAVIRVLKKAKPGQEPMNERGNRVATNDAGDVTPLPSGWPSPSNIELDVGNTDLRITSRYANGVPSPCTLRIVQTDQNGDDQTTAPVTWKAAGVPLNSEEARKFVKTIRGIYPKVRSFALDDGDRFLMGYRILPNNSEEIWWGLVN